MDVQARKGAENSECICGHHHDSHSPYADERGACGWRLCCCEKFQLSGEFGDSQLSNVGENLRADLKKAQDESWENWESIKKWKARFQLYVDHRADGCTGECHACEEALEGLSGAGAPVVAVQEDKQP